MKGLSGALCAAMTLVSVPAGAQDGNGSGDERPSRTGAEIAVGLFEHGSNFHPLGSRLTFDTPPPGIIYEGAEEDGTADVQLVYRSAPLSWALRPRLTGKLQLSTAGRTSFASVGAEWRQHILRRRVYGQIGIGATIHDGYRFTPDPFEPGIAIGEALQRYNVYANRVSFGSRMLFNPNASIGVRVDHRWAIEVAWEHFSHRQVFNEQNPGIDNLGVRLIRSLGRKRR